MLFFFNLLVFLSVQIQMQFYVIDPSHLLSTLRARPFCQGCLSHCITPGDVIPQEYDVSGASGIVEGRGCALCFER